MKNKIQSLLLVTWVALLSTLFAKISLPNWNYWVTLIGVFFILTSGHYIWFYWYLKQNVLVLRQESLREGGLYVAKKSPFCSSAGLILYLTPITQGSHGENVLTLLGQFGPALRYLIDNYELNITTSLDAGHEPAVRVKNGRLELDTWAPLSN